MVGAPAYAPCDGAIREELLSTADAIRPGVGLPHAEKIDSDSFDFLVADIDRAPSNGVGTSGAGIPGSDPVCA